MNIKITRLLVAVAGLSFAFAAAPAYGQAQSPQALCDSASAQTPEVREYDAPEQVLVPGTDYLAIFCTAAGAVTVDLYENATPETVNNFVFLAQNGFYNNTTFHRVIADFMAQGGDPSATGAGGPGYEFADEFVGALFFDRAGLLAMANAGPNTNGSQFFITTAATDWLDYRHTIFGEVIAGYENVTAIEIRDPATATTAGTSLNTVLIVEDPALLDVEIASLAEATREDVQAALDDIANGVGEPLSINSEITTITDGDDYTAGLEDAAAAILAENGLEFHAGAQIDNSGCLFDQFPIGSFGYSLDAFADADAATAALDSGVFADLLETQGFVMVEGSPIYTRTTSFCDQAMVAEAIVYQVGRFVATAYVTFINDGSFAPGAIVNDFARLNFERVFTDVLRPEY